MPKSGFPPSPTPQLEEGGRILRNYFPRAATGRLMQEPTQSKKVTQILTQAPVPVQGGPKEEKGAGKPAGPCSARTAASIFEARGHVCMSELALGSQGRHSAPGNSLFCCSWFLNSWDYFHWRNPMLSACSGAQSKLRTVAGLWDRRGL